MRRPDASRICLTTTYDAHFRQLGLYCTTTLHHYARRHGYAVRTAQHGETERPPAWSRIPWIRSLFDEGHEYVVWLDADALFVRFDVDIRTLIEPDVDFYLVAHEHSNLTNGRAPNTGVMMLRNCAWSRDLLDTLWGMERYVNHALWENAALLSLLGYRELVGEGPDALNTALLARIRYIPEAWNTLAFYPRVDDPMVMHFAGLPHEQRFAEMPVQAVRACFRDLETLHARAPRSSWRRWLAGGKPERV